MFLGTKRGLFNCERVCCAHIHPTDDAEVVKEVFDKVSSHRMVPHTRVLLLSEVNDLRQLQASIACWFGSIKKAAKVVIRDQPAMTGLSTHLILPPLVYGAQLPVKVHSDKEVEISLVPLVGGTTK